MQVNGVPVIVTYQDVRCLRLRILPSNGEVHLSVPWNMEEQGVTAFLNDHSEWMKAKLLLIEQRQQEKEEYGRNGISLLGRFYDFRFFEDSVPSVAVMERSIDFYLPDIASEEKKKSLLDNLLRSALMAELDILIPEWSSKMNVNPKEWRIRQMRTRWGTCNTVVRRIWFNLELSKRPCRLIEYIVVHELCHLLERGHTRRFYGFMDHFLPDWKKRRKELNTNHF